MIACGDSTEKSKPISPAVPDNTRLKDLCIKNCSRAVVELLLFYFDFFMNKSLGLIEIIIEFIAVQGTKDEYTYKRNRPWCKR